MGTPPAPAHRNGRPPWPRWLAWLVLLLGLALVGHFGARAWRQHTYSARVEQGQVQVPGLRGWMTLPYIARVYGVPESELRAALGAPPSGHAERSLREWIAAGRLDPDAARAAVEALVLQAQRPGTSGRVAPRE